MEEFNGTGLIVWFSDGKMKYATHDDQDTMKDELLRIKQNIPNRCIFMGVINWDDQSIEPFIGEDPEALPS